MPRRFPLCLPVAFLGLVLTVLPAQPHTGGLDDFGCHDGPKHGDYHCHRGSLAGHAFASQAEMLQVLEGRKPDPGKGLEKGEVYQPATATEPGQTCIREHRTKQIMCGEVVR
jgi:hypothetical protein